LRRRGGNYAFIFSSIERGEVENKKEEEEGGRLFIMHIPLGIQFSQRC
jgi:hypothetical protein